MGTRAVVHCNLNPFGIGKDIWIATHWDGHPESLGADLKASVKAELAKLEPKRRTMNYIGDVLQKAVWKACADHSVDFSSVESQAEFNKTYGDFAEYEYEITKDGILRYRPRTGEWHGSKSSGRWKSMGKVFGKLPE